jgi:hypothetical protein
MSQQFILPFVAVLLSCVGLNISLIASINNEKFSRPILWAVGINLLYAIIVGGAIYKFFDWISAIVSVILPVIFSCFDAFYVVPKRDKKGIQFGETFLKYLHGMDLSINYILAHYIGLDEASLLELVRRSIDSILDYVVFLLDEKSKNGIKEVSLLLALGDGRFEVLGSKCIPPHLISVIEEKFYYGENPVSIAGNALYFNKIILINDLRNYQKYPEAEKWYSLPNQPCEGSVISVPIFRDVGDYTKGPMAVLSVASASKNAFDIDLHPYILTQICAKIETLLYIRELLC